MLTSAIRSREDLAAEDSRHDKPRFSEENFDHNLRLVEQVETIARAADATPAQVALAWLLAQGNDIAPIPGTRRVTRLEENLAADAVELTKKQISCLTALGDAAGANHDEAQMKMIER